MDQISEFVDQRQKSWCVHCGGWIQDLPTNRDHMPSKSLLLEPYPTNLRVVEVCRQCNSEFSRDEQYLATFLSCVLAGSTEPERQPLPSAARTLAKSAKLKARMVRSQTSFQTTGGETRLVWKPEQRRIDRIVLKNARGHAYYEYGEPMLDRPAHIWSAPLMSLTESERRAFEDADDGDGWPEVGSRMMTRVITGQDLNGHWVIVQEGAYRYCVARWDTIIVRSVMHEYLATEVLWPN